MSRGGELLLIGTWFFAFGIVVGAIAARLGCH